MIVIALTGTQEQIDQLAQTLESIAQQCATGEYRITSNVNPSLRRFIQNHLGWFDQPKKKQER